MDWPDNDRDFQTFGSAQDPLSGQDPSGEVPDSGRTQAAGRDPDMNMTGGFPDMPGSGTDGFLTGSSQNTETAVLMIVSAGALLAGILIAAGYRKRA